MLKKYTTKGTKFKKALCLAIGAALLSGQAAPFAALAAEPTNRLLNEADTSDIERIQECLRKSGVDSYAPENLMGKGFKLTNYEMLVISEIIKRDIQQKAEDSDQKYAALSDLVDLQKQYAGEYQMIFNSLPKEIQKAASEVEKSPNRNIVNFAKTAGGEKSQPADQTAQQEQPAETPAASQKSSDTFAYNPTADDIAQMAEKYGIPVIDPGKAAQDVKNYREAVEDAESPQGLSDAMSLINIRRNPQTAGGGDYQYSNPLNPVQELNSEKDYISDPDKEASIETENDKANIRSMQDIIDEAANIEDRKAKHFFLTVAHSLYYLDSGNEGTQKLDTNYRDDNGNLYVDANPDEHEVKETLEIGLGIRVHKALDLMVSMLAKNEDGMLNEDGTSWEFGNVLFKFHPERIDKAALKKLNSEGIIIKDGGKTVGKRIGHSSTIVTDTETGDTALQIGSADIKYDKDEGLQFSNEDSRYYIGFGKMSLNLSTYTLQLSDCKAVKIGYHDNDQELLLLYGRPEENATDGYTTESGSKVAGKYQKDVLAAQYIAKNLIPDMQLTFNFAKEEDKGNLSQPNGTQKGTNSVYSLMLRGGTPSGSTSYEGEFARLKNTVQTDKGNVTTNSRADYLDITHQFSDKLSGKLHYINVDGTYDASSLVEDKTGEFLKTTTKGDGTPDYLYQPGQRGFDLNLDYELDKKTALAFAYSKYTETEEGNAKTEFSLSGGRQWSLAGGTLNVQQHFGYNDVSNKTYVTKSSDTTVSYSGSPWAGGNVSADFQRTVDTAKGNETRYDFTASHEFTPAERVTITPKVSYERKVGEDGKEEKNDMDTTTIINAVTVGYELIPDELTVNFLVSKEKYNVIASEIDESTGKKVDGERRNTLGVGLGLSWEPKKIAGLTVGLSYRRDKVDYLDRKDNSNQDVWEYSLEYSRPISDKIRASISYNYRSARDKIKPIYDDVTRDISADIDARIGNHSSIQLQHEYSSEYKPMDSKANSTTHTTTLQMVNRF